MESYLKSANFVRFSNIQPYIKVIASEIFRDAEHRDTLEHFVGKPFDEIEFTHEEAIRCCIKAGMESDP